MLTLFALDTPMFRLALPDGTPVDPILEMKAKEEKTQRSCRECASSFSGLQLSGCLIAF